MYFRLSQFSIFSTFLLFSFFQISTLRAEEISPPEKTWGINLSSDLLVGRLSSSGMGLSERSMSALGIESLFGHYIDDENTLIGLSLNYRIEKQLTALSETGNTNLSGTGWLIGIGVNKKLSPQLLSQTILNFVGEYEFDQRDLSGKSANLSKVIGLQFRLQYKLNSMNNWSLDTTLNYNHWSEVKFGGSTFLSNGSTDWTVGIGATYFWNSTKTKGSPDVRVETPEVKQPEAPVKAEEPVVVKAPVKIETAVEAKAPTKVEPPAKIDPIQISTEFEKFEIPMHVIWSDKAIAERKPKIDELAEYLKNNPTKKVRIEGYSDALVDATNNKFMAQHRADIIKSELLKRKIEPSRIISIGKGVLLTNPIEIKYGNRKNRKVIIIITD